MGPSAYSLGAPLENEHKEGAEEGQPCGLTLLHVREKSALKLKRTFEWHCELGAIIKGFLEEMGCHLVYKG